MTTYGKLDKVETTKLMESLHARLGADVTGIDVSSDILFHMHLKNPYRGKSFRDNDENLWKINDWDAHIHIDAGINPAGIGDGKEPNIAMTYSIGFSIRGEKRLYKHKYFYEDEYKKFYGYSRDMHDIVQRFIEWYNNSITK